MSDAKEPRSAFNIRAFGGLPNIGAIGVIRASGSAFFPTFVSIRVHSWLVLKNCP